MMPPPMMTISAWVGSLLMSGLVPLKVAGGMLATGGRGCKPQGSAPSLFLCRHARESGHPGQATGVLDSCFRGNDEINEHSGLLAPGETGFDVVDAGHDVGDAVDDVMGAGLGQALDGDGPARGALGLGELLPIRQGEADFIA